MACPGNEKGGRERAARGLFTRADRADGNSINI
jgi:hypothetical protein